MRVKIKFASDKSKIEMLKEQAEIKSDKGVKTLKGVYKTESGDIVGVYHNSYGNQFLVMYIPSKGKMKGKLSEYDEYSYDSVDEAVNEYKMKKVS